MLAIRLQRTGRKGHAQFRMVVQEARLTPTSGKVVARLGSYDPHSKAMAIEKDKAAFYLSHGAQPSDRVARLLKKEGVKLPKWVTLEDTTGRAVRNPDKLRKNRPAEPKAAAEPAPESKKAEEAVTEVSTDESAADTETAAPEAAETATEKDEAAAETAPDSGTPVQEAEAKTADSDKTEEKT